MEEITSSPMRTYAQFRRFLFVLLIVTPVLLIVARLYHNPGFGAILIAYTPFYFVARAAVSAGGDVLWIALGAGELAVVILTWYLCPRRREWMTILFGVYVVDTVFFLIYNISLLTGGQSRMFMTVIIGLLLRAMYCLLFWFGWTSRVAGTMTDEELVAAGIAPEVPFGLTNRRGDRDGYARFEPERVLLIQAMGTGKGSQLLKSIPYGDIVRLAFDPEDNNWLCLRLPGGTDPEIKLSVPENRERFLQLMGAHGVEHPSLKKKDEPA